MMIFQCDKCQQHFNIDLATVRIKDLYGSTFAEICPDCFEKLKGWLSDYDNLS